jgi:flagellar biosynthesis component FlhA
MLRDAGIGMFNVMTYVFHQMGQVLRDFPEDIFSLMDVQSMVREIDQRFPGFVLGAFNGQSVNLGVLTEFCQQLVREGESVADFRMIIEIFSGYFSKYAANLGNVHEVQISDIVSFYRQSRRRRIIGKWIGSAGRLRAILLSPNLEEALELARLDTQSNSLTLDLSEVESAEGALRVILHPIRTKGVVPVVVLCRAELRERVTALVRMIGERIAVLAIEELEPSNKLETVGVWSWG